MTDQEAVPVDDLSDVDEAPQFDWRSLDPRLLRSPTVLRAVAVMVIALAVLLWPNRSSLILGRLLGLGVLAFGLSALQGGGLPRRREDVIGFVGGVAAVVGGAYMTITPSESNDLLATLLALTLLVVAVRDLYRLRSTAPEIRGWLLTRSVAFLAVGAVLLAFPDEIFFAVVTIMALVWLAVSAVVIVASLDPATSGTSSYVETVQLIGEWFGQRSKSVDDRHALYDKIFYEGSVTQMRVVRFFALMGFASVIASTGVIADSTAVVIGAMLIAPLMTPLMGMAISLVMGWPRRLGRSALIAAGGIVFAILVGLFVGLLSPTIIETTVNSQIVGRSSPTILDLVTAMAAGAAGAYGLSRPDVSDSLPGVAIAISLVPPLTVVGIAYSQGDWASGNGALLLFLTNMLAILIVGGLTFVATGVTPLRQVADNQHRVRTWIGAVAGMAAVVLGALLLNGAEITANLAQQSLVESTVADWIGDDGHDVIQIDSSGDVIVVTVIGPTDGLAAAGDLATALAEELDRAVEVDVRLVVEERERASAEP